MSIDTEKVQQEETKTPNNKFCIVGVGASAGGLEALERLFERVPIDIGVAFVVIQHLAPDFRSLMDELLSRRTRLPVRQAGHAMVVEPNSIYLLPPGKDMIISNGRLLLADKAEAGERSLPIDLFFSSLADDIKSRAIGIILSGTGNDGSQGIRRIHEARGLVIVQTKATAKFDGMPNSARLTGVVDYVVPPEQISDVIVRNLNRPAEPPVPADADGDDNVQENAMDAVFALLRKNYGIDFTFYKPSTIIRRIERRLMLNQQFDLAEYVQRVSSDPTELNRLYEDLLIGVTHFFRDPEAFERLELSILPEIIAGIEPNGEFRVWIAATATGEEAYSIAILLTELLEQDNRGITAKIFATDVHRESLDAASIGVYQADTLENVSPERRKRFFVERQDGLQIHPDIRKMVVFARHDVIKDAPFTNMHLITCRNLLIYLRPSAQKKVLSLLHFGLRINGMLWLGPSETLGDLVHEFESLDEHWRFFRKTHEHKLTAALHTPTPGLQSESPHEPFQRHSSRALLETYDRVLDRFIPPSLLISEERTLLHAFAGAGRFLQIRDGRPSLDVFDAMPAELRVALSAAVNRARNEKHGVLLNHVRIPEETSLYSISVEPVYNRVTRKFNFVITFQTVDTPQTIGSGEQTLLEPDEATTMQIRTLESELRFTKENLQTTIQELESTNEELQATNEELVASNEQLQSTNEELHSVNEELYTVNAEYQRKIRELTELTDDMENFLNSTEVDTIFVDREFRIRRFTSGIAATFNLISQDVGRPIQSFTHSIEGVSLIPRLKHVLETERSFEQEVRDRAGNWYLLRLFPYVSGGIVDGIVLTLIHINSLKNAETELRELSAIVQQSHDAIFRVDLSGVIRTWNRGATRLYGYRSDETIGESIGRLIAPDNQTRLFAILAAVREGLPTEEEEGLHLRKDGQVVSVAFTISPILNDVGMPIAASIVSRDTTEQKAAERTIRDSVVRRDRFLAMLSHELRNPLNAIQAAGNILQDREPDAAADPEAVDAILRQSSHMCRLLDDLLDVARITQDRIDMKNTLHDYRETTKAAIEQVLPVAAERKHRLEIQITDEPLPILGDPTRLQQLQVNLLANAVKFTDDGGLIKIKVFRENDQIVTLVSDSGIGMSPDFVEQSFELFVRGSADKIKGRGRMGVGLALVKKIAELHLGSIRVECLGRNVGTLFEVRLPLGQQLLKQAEPNLPVSPRVAGEGVRKLVVIDDNDDNRSLLCKLLISAGHAVLHAADGISGAELILSTQPDVAVIDIDLPDIDGYEVARRVRDDRSLTQPLLIALTGYGRKEDREAALAAGFDYHLIKPLNVARLKELIRLRDPSTQST